MQKQTLCFLVVGASLAVLLQKLAGRRSVTNVRPVTRPAGAEIIDLADWKQSRGIERVALSAQ